MHLVQVGQPAFRAHDQAGLASRSRMLQRPQLAQIKSQLFSANRRPWPVHDSAYGGGGGPPANSKRLGSFDRGPNRGWLFALGPLYVLSLFCASALYDAGQAYKGPTINWKSKLQSISFIIPTLNEELCISDCVRSLRDGHDPFLEIIVVDGGSTDQTIAKALKAGAKVVKAKKKGRACQMNAGAEAAKGDILLFLHADTSISSHAADSIRDALSDEKTILVGLSPRIEHQGHYFPFLSLHNLIKTWYGPLLFRPASFVTGLRLLFGDQTLSCRAADFRGLKGFNDQLPIMEDADLCLRMHQGGRRVKMLLNETATTSGRRMAAWGPLKATCIHFLISISWYMGASYDDLAKLYNIHYTDAFR